MVAEKKQAEEAAMAIAKQAEEERIAHELEQAEVRAQEAEEARMAKEVEEARVLVKQKQAEARKAEEEMVARKVEEARVLVEQLQAEEAAAQKAEEERVARLAPARRRIEQERAAAARKAVEQSSIHWFPDDRGRKKGKNGRPMWNNFVLFLSFSHTNPPRRAFTLQTTRTSAGSGLPSKPPRTRRSGTRK